MGVIARGQLDRRIATGTPGLHHAGQVERGIERCLGTGAEFLCCVFFFWPEEKIK